MGRDYTILRARSRGGTLRPMRRLAAAVLAASLSACAELPPVRSSLDQGLLIARVDVQGAFFRRFQHAADAGEIVALDAKDAPIPGLRAYSAFASNDYIVFFGLPQGRYVLRDVSFPARGVRYRLSFPRESEGKRAVELGKGRAAFLGRHVFESRWPSFGVALGRAGRIVGHWLTPFLRRPTLPRDGVLREDEADRSEETRALLAVREALAGTPWRRLIEVRLRELGAPEPAKTEGALRARALPLHEEPYLSWRDTLKWGEPRRVPDALAWRRPGGEAQIAVFFTTASAPGFLGWEASVAELRRSARGSVEDRGGLYEVRVATRTGLAARVTRYVYPKGVLVGSETTVVRTETVLVPDGYGQFTARLRAPREEFDAALPQFREFLIQLRLGPPPPKPPPKQEAVLPFVGGP